MNTQPHDDDVAWPDDAVEVARVQDAWGIKGWLRVQPHAADPQALFSSRRWFLQPPAGKPRPKDAPPLPRLLHVTLVKEHGDGIVASVREVADRNGAEALKGARIFVSRQSFPSTDDGEYYWVDLIGLAVVNREGVPLGTVRDLLPTGPQTTLVLGYEHEGKAQERMIPFVSAFVDKVDLAGCCITVDWQPDY